MGSEHRSIALRLCKVFLLIGGEKPGLEGPGDHRNGPVEDAGPEWGSGSADGGKTNKVPKTRLGDKQFVGDG